MAANRDYFARPIQSDRLSDGYGRTVLHQPARAESWASSIAVCVLGAAAIVVAVLA